MTAPQCCISAIGQDSHRFESEGSNKPLVLGGVTIPGCQGLSGNSDADVVLHSLTNALSGLHGVPVLGKMADDICLNRGIRDSRVYCAKALEFLTEYTIAHVSMTIEARRPPLAAHLPAIRESIARLLSLPSNHIAITVTSGEGLTAFGRGEGIQVFTIISAHHR